jgi:basic membrane protein A and related proteins
MRSPLRLAATLAALVILGTAAACNASAPQSSGGSGGASGGSQGPSLILVTPEPAGANEFLKLSIKGIQEAAQALNGTSRVFESQDISKVAEQLNAAVAAKPAVVAVVGFEFVDSIAKVAPENPDQKFLFVDACTPQPLPNVTCAVFREHEAVYLAGVEAGLLTKSDKVGAVVALDTPQIRRFSDPFGDGAKSANKSVKFTPLFVGGSNPFNDPGRAKEQALSLANAGVDIVMAASAGGNAGVFDAAKSSGLLAFGVDTNQCPQAPGVVLDNVLKEVNVAMVAATKDIVAGKAGGLKSYGLAENAVTLSGLSDDVAGSGCVIAKHQDVIDQVKKIRDDVVSKKITVDDPATS